MSVYIEIVNFNENTLPVSEPAASAATGGQMNSKESDKGAHPCLAVDFKFTLLHPTDYADSVTTETSHRFSVVDTDRGFSKFISLKRLDAYLENDRSEKTEMLIYYMHSMNHIGSTIYYLSSTFYLLPSFIDHLPSTIQYLHRGATDALSKHQQQQRPT